MLENVFNLEKHDKGRTLKVMLDALNDLGYMYDLGIGYNANLEKTNSIEYIFSNNIIITITCYWK